VLALFVGWKAKLFEEDITSRRGVRQTIPSGTPLSH
jgi:hypothetical protein